MLIDEARRTRPARGRARSSALAPLMLLLIAVAEPSCERQAERENGGAGSGRDGSASLAVGSDAWSAAEARARLAEPSVAVSAAIRLVRLSKLDVLCVPDRMSAAWLARLRVVEIGADGFALGVADPRNARRLRCPVLFDADGRVQQVVTGPDEELLVLHLGDTQSFPHVAYVPDQVWVIEDELISAILAAPGVKARFDVRAEADGEVLVLLTQSGAGETEAARYVWSTSELAFMGPAALDLPDPPGGMFEVDLDSSERLEPVGGQMPAPKENPPPPEDREPRPMPRDV